MLIISFIAASVSGYPQLYSDNGKWCGLFLKIFEILNIKAVDNQVVIVILIYKVFLYSVLCSKICGANHSFILIAIERFSPSSFIT